MLLWYSWYSLWLLHMTRTIALPLSRDRLSMQKCHHCNNVWAVKQNVQRSFGPGYYQNMWFLCDGGLRLPASPKYFFANWHEHSMNRACVYSRANSWNSACSSIIIWFIFTYFGSISHERLILKLFGVLFKCTWCNVAISTPLQPMFCARRCTEYNMVHRISHSAERLPCRGGYKQERPKIHTWPFRFKSVRKSGHLGMYPFRSVSVMTTIVSFAPISVKSPWRLSLSVGTLFSVLLTYIPAYSIHYCNRTQISNS